MSKGGRGKVVMKLIKSRCAFENTCLSRLNSATRRRKYAVSEGQQHHSTEGGKQRFWSEHRQHSFQSTDVSFEHQPACSSKGQIWKASLFVEYITEEHLR